MSIKLMGHVWERRFTKAEQAVLLAMADHANDDGGDCFPSIPRIAWKTDYSERQVQRVMHKLTTQGVLVVVRKAGRGRGTEYRIDLSRAELKAPFDTQKGDTMSPKPKKGDTMSPQKRVTSATQKGDILNEKGDIHDRKGDILPAFPSHARSEPPIQPSEQPSIESSSSDEDEDGVAAASAVDDAWLQHFGQPMPENVMPVMNRLIDECGAAAVAHGIAAGAAAGARTFGYIAKCARNYIPPAPTVAPSYAVDLPGVHRLEPPPQATAKPLPKAMQHSDPWAIALGELQASLPGVARDYLAGSRLEAAGAVDGVPLYRVVCDDRAAVGLTWLTAQAGPAIRRKLGSVLGKPVLVEIVAATEAETELVHA